MEDDRHGSRIFREVGGGGKGVTMRSLKLTPYEGGS